MPAGIDPWMAIGITVEDVCHKCDVSDECSHNVWEFNGGCAPFDEYYDRLMGKENAMATQNEYFVFIVRRRYAFGATGDIEATVLIPQDIDTSIVEEIEAFLSDKHSDMWAGPFMDEFRVTLDDSPRSTGWCPFDSSRPCYTVGCTSLCEGYDDIPF